MIDSGSTRSFLSPQKAYKYFSPYLSYEPYEVISTHGRSNHDEVIQVPLMPTFNSPAIQKFYLYDVDPRYDGLIGYDILKDAIVNLRDGVLETKTAKIPIVHNAQNYALKIPPRAETRVKVPTDRYSGDVILNYTEFCEGVRMPDAIVCCDKGYATTVIQNALETEMDLVITSPFKTTDYTPNEIDSNFIDSDLSRNEDILLTQNLTKLRLDHMNPEERACIEKLCHEYKDIFYCDQIPLTFTNQVKHFIRTKNEDPIYTKPYRQPPTVTDEIRRQVDKLLKDNIIQESHSPWNAPVHLVSKKLDASGEQKYRMVIDYRRLNDITIDDKYPLPNITDLFDKLGKSTYFTTLDLASGYHQIEVNESDRQKTAFSTQSGHYEFLRMPFGLKTAPATFQRTMDNVLRGLQGIHCMVYLDDIIVFSTSLQEHIQKLRTVFDRLRQTNLKVQLDKSEFLRKEVLYLGHTITKDGLKPNNDKITAVLNYPLPKTTTEIKSFLGLIGYYRRFIKDFARITQPLTACLKKRNKIVIDQKYIDAFEKCKELLTNAPLLQFPDHTKPFILTTDASNVALGAVLSQGPIGQDKPVAYASRTLSDTESRYSTIEKELLAVVWATKHFRPYLYGRKFDIYTDHKPLEWLNSLKEPNSKLMRWRLKMQEFDYNIKYKKGKLNANADSLSRIKINALNSDNENDDDVSMKVNVDKRDELAAYIKELEDKITELGKAKQESFETITISDESATITISDDSNSEQEFPIIPNTSSTNTVHSAQELESFGIPILHEAIDTKPNQIFIFQWFKNDLQVTDLSREKQKILEAFMPTNNDEIIKRFLKEYIKPKCKYFIYFENETFRKDFSRIVIDLFKRGSVEFFECTQRVVYIEDEKEQKAIILKYHEGPTCHRGIKETAVRIRRNYYWENMTQTVAAILNGCEACRKMKYDRKPLKPVLQLTQTQNAPFQEVFMDVFSIEGKHYLTLVDAFSKLAQAFEIPNRSTPEVVRALTKYFSFYGVPRKLSCDPGSEFNNELLKELMNLQKIDLHITTPNNPNSTSIVERFHSTIIEIYRLARYEQKCTDAAQVMTYAIMAYNNTIHSTTNLTPFEVVFGHTSTNKVFDCNFERDYTQQLLKDHSKRMKYLYGYICKNTLEQKEKVRERKGGEGVPSFEIGDTVFAKDVNKRKAKDKDRYQKAIVIGQPIRNVLPVRIGTRETKVPIKNVKRPPQVVESPDPDDDTRHARPSTSKH